MKKSNLIFISFALLTGSLFTSCYVRNINGDGNIVTKQIPISNYNELQIQGDNIELTYTQSDDAPFLQIETDQNILDILETGVTDDELTIRPNDRHISIKPTRFVIKTNSKGLEELKMAGEGEGRLAGVLRNNNLDLRLAGSGIITADSLIVNDLECEIAGSGKMILTGKAENTKIKSAGSCEVKAFNLTTEKLDCKTAGSNDIEITVTRSISAKMAGSGDLKYKGNPDKIHNKSVGSCSVIRVE